ncbi:GNAT family N-acetyltransferase [Synergistaceae bacterium OttesenSCG-928-D05]|nr:GNAT family N-acetyltransferase [Synergistaceae bacterium OttesenSCG-928-D05]
MGYSILPYDKKYDKSTFSCGVPPLDDYLQKQAGQDMRKHYAALFVAVDEEARIVGYYTLSNASIPLLDIPENMKKKLPKYADVPAIRLGRLAVDKRAQGQGLGADLLADAVFRAVSNVSAWTVLVVDAKDETAVAFYQKFGFAKLLDDDRHLYIMRQSIEDFLQGV